MSYYMVKYGDSLQLTCWFSRFNFFFSLILPVCEFLSLDNRLEQNCRTVCNHL
jgi:hypothetical protein